MSDQQDKCDMQATHTGKTIMHAAEELLFVLLDELCEFPNSLLARKKPVQTIQHSELIKPGRVPFGTYIATL